MLRQIYIMCKPRNEIKDKLSGIMIDKIRSHARRNSSSDKITEEIKSSVI